MERPINIGDEINLEITGASLDEIKEGFKDVDITLKENNIISLRLFKTGDNEFKIKNNEVSINVQSVITKEDKEIYTNFSDNSNNLPFNAPLPYGFLLSTTLFILGSIYFRKEIFKLGKKIKKLSPEEEFLEEIKKLSTNEFAYNLSHSLRKYIDSKYQLNYLAGKYTKHQGVSKDDIEFLNSLDFYKFSNAKDGDLEKYKNKTIEIFERIKEETNV